jgi:Bacterial regulatory helix-turn-helix protein, lysR family
LIKAAELLHFTHAAEPLYLSQPALSTHTRQLEEELGLPLFDQIIDPVYQLHINYLLDLVSNSR